MDGHKIHKYEISIKPDGIVELELPYAAKVLHFGVDYTGAVVAWAQFPTNEECTRMPNKIQTFRVVATGEDFNGYDGSEYFQTVIIPTRFQLVWHFFKVAT